MDTLIYLIKKYSLILILGLVMLLAYFIFIFNKQEPKTEIAESIEIPVEKEEIVSNIIKINIKGAIKNPGVYEIENNSRVEDAIKIAGGLTEDADTSIINLSKKLNDENVIIIYTKDEVKKIKQGNVVIQYIEKECNCPEYENSACIDPDELVNSKGENSNNTTNNGKISLNTATIDELQTLSGIGESKAKSIIEYRNNNGGFKSIDEIKNVKGIGDAIFEKIKDNITI